MITRNLQPMYQTHKVYIKADMILSELVLENPSILLMMEFFEIDTPINDLTVAEICQKHNIHSDTFIVFANLYNGFLPNTRNTPRGEVDIMTVIQFLKHTHQFYIKEKYPKIQHYIKGLYNKQDRAKIERIEFFFKDYFDEVLEHLRYEDEIAFPYFCKLIENDLDIAEMNFSVNEYRTHHGDIETKLSDLKNLLIKHIDLKEDFPLKRKIITSLFELEHDLRIHSMIEDVILLPAVDQLEKNKNIGN